MQTSKRHLERWVAQQIDGLRCLNLRVRLLLGKACGEFTGQEEGPGKAVALWSSDCDSFVVGPALEALESLLAGLGQTVLTVIDLVGPKLVPAFTPWDVMGTCQQVYWYGEEDESIALEEMCGEDESARDEMRGSMVTRQLVDEAFPEWACLWPRRRRNVSLQVLSSVALGARSHKVQRVAGLVMALKRLRLKLECRPNADGWFIGYGPVLAWRDGDLVTRVFDDFANQACEGDYIDWCGEHRFDLEDEGSVRTWVKLMKERLKGIRLFDQLIYELSTGDWSRIQKGLR